MTRTSITEAREVAFHGLSAVSPERLVTEYLTRNDLARRAEAARNVVVVGAGKAALAMAATLERAFGDLIAPGIVVVPHGYGATLPAAYRPPSRIAIVEAGHPIPDPAGETAARRALETVRACGEGDLVIALISGGASALWAAYAPGITIEDAGSVTGLLLHSGAPIHDINTVRKHLSVIGGGRLAAAAHPATVEALIISDVIGDDPSFIGSGPCSPDTTTTEDAIHVLRRFNIFERVPASVRAHLESSLDESAAGGSTPDIRASTTVIGSNAMALDAMAAAANTRGLSVSAVLRDVSGEAREIGHRMAERADALQPNTCIIWGGEPTVTVVGEGTGGRNQELVLAASLTLHDAHASATILSIGTDGIDGATAAAGAWADRNTVARASSMGHDARIALARNDSGSFFQAIGQHIITGPTHTNVMDIGIALSEISD